MCLAEMGRSSFGLFHDILNPISSLILYLDLITKKNFEDQKIKNDLKPILKSSKKIASFIKIIQSDFADQKIKHEHNKIDDIISNCIKILSHKSKQQNVSILFIREKNCTLFCQKTKIYRLVMNFLSNSIDSFESIKDSRKRKVIIKLYENKKNIFIEFNDNGCGIKDEEKNKIFNLLYTTKKHGNGVGLYHIKKIIEKDLSGKITFDSKLFFGTNFKIQILKKQSHYFETESF